MAGEIKAESGSDVPRDGRRRLEATINDLSSPRTPAPVEPFEWPFAVDPDTKEVKDIISGFVERMTDLDGRATGWHIATPNAPRIVAGDTSMGGADHVQTPGLWIAADGRVFRYLDGDVQDLINVTSDAIMTFVWGDDARNAGLPWHSLPIAEQWQVPPSERERQWNEALLRYKEASAQALDLFAKMLATVVLRTEALQ